MVETSSEILTTLSGQYLDKTRLERLIDKMSPPAGTASGCLYLKPNSISVFMESGGKEDLEWKEQLVEIGDAVTRSDTGLVALRSGSEGILILPPFPVLNDYRAASWDVQPLAEILEADRLTGVVLLRLGRYSVAVYQGERLLSSKTDARYVKGRHAAGGTSQKRYSRIREGQIRKIYDKTCQVIRDQFTPYQDSLEFVFLGGDQFTLNGLIKVCPMLERLKSNTLSRRLNIRDPKRDTLEDVGRMLKQSRVYPLTWSKRPIENPFG